MDAVSYGPRFDSNPLLEDAPEVWDQLVDALAPATILASIRHRMSATLLAQLSPEDVWQETLLRVWRDRDKCDWRGLPAFKRWVLTVAENLIRNEVESMNSIKRGGGRAPASITGSEELTLPPPVSSTTPSRVASYAEEAEALHCALMELPLEYRDVVRLRHFEEYTVEQVAAQLNLGVSAVKHRSRKGASLYEQRVQAALAAREPSRAENERRGG